MKFDEIFLIGLFFGLGFQGASMAINTVVGIINAWIIQYQVSRGTFRDE